MTWKTDNAPANASVQINAQVSHSTREKLRSKAKLANLSMRDYLAAVIESSVVESKPSVAADIRAVAAWLGRINGNLYQLTRGVNFKPESADCDVIAMRLALIHADIRDLSDEMMQLKAKHARKPRKKAAETAPGATEAVEAPTADARVTL